MSSSSSIMAEQGRKGKRILVAVDNSDESTYALSWFLANFISGNPSSISNDTIILLYAKPRPGVYTAMDGTGYSFSSDIMATTEMYNDGLAGSVMEKGMAICGKFGGVKVETMVEGGDAKDVICRMAKKLGPDLLVMGSHGYGRIKRALLGSVSHHCAQNVECPVLVVKKPKSSLSTADGH